MLLQKRKQGKFISFCSELTKSFPFPRQIMLAFTWTTTHPNYSNIYPYLPNKVNINSENVSRKAHSRFWNTYLYFLLAVKSQHQSLLAMLTRTLSFQQLPSPPSPLTEEKLHKANGNQGWINCGVGSLRNFFILSVSQREKDIFAIKSNTDRDTIFPTTAPPLTDEKLHKHNESSESKNKGHWEPLVEKIPKKHCPQ